MASVNYYNSKRSDSYFMQKDYKDQLNEINTYSQSDLKFETNGIKVYPKSINVTKIFRSKFQSSLNFNRILKISSDALFKESFTLSTDDFKVASVLNQAVDSIESKILKSLEDRTNREIEMIQEKRNSTLSEVEVLKNAASKSSQEDIQTMKILLDSLNATYEHALSTEKDNTANFERLSILISSLYNMASIAGSISKCSISIYFSMTYNF